MVNIRAITVLRTIALARAAREQAVSTQVHAWKWAEGTMVAPETVCCFCKEKVRFKGVLRIDKNWHHYGQFLFSGRTSSRQLRLGVPYYPHMVNPVTVCRGDARTPAQLFASPIYPGGASMSYTEIARWYNTYLGHRCRTVKDYLNPSTGEEDEEVLDDELDDDEETTT